MNTTKERDELEDIKDKIVASYDYFRRNTERYHEFMKFVFLTSISSEEEEKLSILQKPCIEFNVLESQVSRLRGEFSKYQPDIIPTAADGVRVDDLTPEFLQTIEVVGDHIREIFFSATNDSWGYNTFSDLLGGGYSVSFVSTDYINEMSFEQAIKIERAFDPTLTGFDPLARESHKGDGGYAFQLIPKTKDEFEEEFGKGLAQDMKFQRGEQSDGLGGFSWSYVSQQQPIVLVADYYYKKKKKEKIVKLANGHVVLKKHYAEFLRMWDEQGFVEQAPIVIEERSTTITVIMRRLICEDKILKTEETSHKFLPLVFIDGNSVNIREELEGATMQVTRPYVFHAKGAQQIINFSGQTVGAEIENMVQHKFKVPLEAIPDGYEDVYKDIQQASTLVYNQFYNDNPEVRLDPPMEIQRTPTPPIVENTFTGTNRMIQGILGNYDSIISTNEKQISGVALQQGALQSNAAAIPYHMGYIKGLNRLAQIIIDLIPKYYVTPRSLPVRKADGKRSYQIVNNPKKEGNINLSYNSNSLQIKVEAGVSSGIQKQVAIDQIIRMSQASPLFAEFINTMGLETMLDNLDIRGLESMKAQAVVFMKEKKEMAAQQAQKGDPMEQMAKEQNETVRQVEMAKVEQQSIKAEGDHAIAMAKVAIEKQNTEIKYMETMAKVQAMAAKAEIDGEKVDSENARSAVELAMDMVKHHHEASKTNDD